MVAIRIVFFLFCQLFLILPSCSQASDFEVVARNEKQHRTLEEANKLGAPMKAVRRAMLEAKKDIYSKTDVLAVFDLSQTSDKKRFYLLDFQAGHTTAYHSAHGRGNGDQLKATRFRGFQEADSAMTPLGPLRTAETVEDLEHYREFQDRYDGRFYRDLIILDLEGTADYNSRFRRGDIWVIGHSNWYVTRGYREKFNGMVGRSLGCLVLDPVYSNEVFRRLSGGALIYVTVGDAPVDRFL